ncbi:MAG: bifunctional oligoribonuclease/PAP phosphatase NrnA [Bacteroidota bacterium]|nr:bifunctional oligoribonuclease/PAP phosphatase NrnA [Bacteroidota bacterium]
MHKFKAFKELLSSPKKVVITTHHKPDADALGSSLGLAGYLKKLNHQVTVVTPSDYPQFLAWMPGNEEVIVYEKKSHKRVAQLFEEAEMIFCLDFSCLSRINEVGDMVRTSSAVKVLIDHHLEPKPFADFEYWDITAAATAEMVFELVEKLGRRDLIDTDIANCLYAGIMTDTGSFKHPNTTKKVHLIVAELIESGANISMVSKLIYDTNTVNRLKFIGFALSEKLVVLEEYNTAYFAISSEELNKYESRTGDTEGLVNFALSIENIVMAAVIIDRAEAIKISFRSIGDFPVNEFAKNHFEGGGHKNAAGGKSNLSLTETINKFEALLPIYKNQLNTTKQPINIHV